MGVKENFAVTATCARGGISNLTKNLFTRVTNADFGMEKRRHT